MGRSFHTDDDDEDDGDDGICPICMIPMIEIDRKNSNEAKISRNKNNSFPKQKRVLPKGKFSSIINKSSRKWKSEIQQLSKEIRPSLYSNLREIQKPINLVGLSIVAFLIILWINLL